MSKGFTLIEILIAITILSVAAVVAIPNIKKFGEDQEIKNISGDIARVVRQAQSSAMSGIKCSDGTASINWRVNVTYAASSTVYSLVCFNGTASRTEYTKTYDGVTRVASAGSCTSNTNLSVIFQGNQVSFACYTSLPEIAVTSYPFEITVQKNNIKNNVSIEKGGSIVVKVIP